MSAACAQESEGHCKALRAAQVWLPASHASTALSPPLSCHAPSPALCVCAGGTTLLDSTVTTSDGVIPPPATLPGRASKTINQPGIIAAISIGCAAVVGIAGFVVSRGLGDQAAKRKDESKSKQLAYIYEMQEMDIGARVGGLGVPGLGCRHPCARARALHRRLQQGQQRQLGSLTCARRKGWHAAQHLRLQQEQEANGTPVCTPWRWHPTHAPSPPLCCTAAEMVAEGKLGDGELQPYVEASGNSRLWAWLGGIPPPDAKQVRAV